ncbi:MAG: hypothetical protein AB7H96_16845 [Vicinamibacterales bacterium]
MRSSLLLHAAGMFLLGTLGLASVGAVHEWRVRREAPPPVQTQGRGTVGLVSTTGSVTSPYPPVLAGIYRRLEQFVQTIDHDRPVAVGALDAARRVTRVLAAASAGPEFASMARAIEAARTAVQNGDIRRARIEARRAATLAAQPVALDIRAPASLASYVGAIVVSPDGRFQGRVSAVSSRTVDLDAGLTRFLGFMPLTHRLRRTVDVSDLLVGRRQPGREPVIVDTGGTGRPRQPMRAAVSLATR